jgi:putative transposase
MIPQSVSYSRHRFPAEIISHAVWLYHVFSLSLRDVELILAERGVIVTHESIRNWCRKFGADFARRLGRRRPRPGDTWHLDEVFIRINGVLHYLWRAVDQHGVVLDILVQGRRNGAAAKRFFKPPAARAQGPAETPHHRWLAQLWRCSACRSAQCSTSDE